MCTKKEVSILDLQATARTWPLLLAAVILFIHNTVLGMSFYYASVTLPYHKNGTHGYIKLSGDQDTSFVSLHQLTMVVATLLGHPLGEKFGRKKILIMSNLLTIFSFLMMHLSTSFPLLLIGRMLSGFSFGLGFLLPLILISEIATIKLRSGMANSVNLAVNFGSLLNYIMNMIIPPEYLAFTIIFTSVIFVMLSALLPESPHWLIRNGDLDSAETIYRALRGPDYTGVEREVKEVFAIVDKTNENIQREPRWKNRSFLYPMGILAVLFSTIGCSGLDAPLTFYGPRMFAEFNFFIPYQYVSLIIPAGSFIGYCVSSVLLNCMRKKHQYVGASLLMAVSTGVMGMAYYFHQSPEHAILAQAMLGIGVMVFNFGYGSGMGAVIYTLPGELLSPEDKTFGVCIAECFRLTWTSIIVKLYPYALAILGQTIMFGFHGLALILSALFVLRFLPETKNKTLSELQNLFKKPTPTAV